MFNESSILESDFIPPNDNESKWKVDAIIDESMINGTPHYKVKWTGYDDEECTWELLEHVEHLDAYKEWIEGKMEMVMSVIEISREPKSYAEALESPDAE